ncbi:glutamate 5-kinase [Beggiatoa leptomitoformis]|uniref:Glutamate 5-kinase n=1 Tax=Beggiatoa leptomitoformis TaxID=288004 RepID=A0A2N9YBD8_9GAMM|nr:glutamate 5-kinase [Beggiatoa leptomitoformis]ALG66889.1 glutamate 5-kinase [Beggiatoa leptomitoformis]AUI67752.1 glutamate 5-kinase [Beggiatoa leptomitoformis]
MSKQTEISKSQRWVIKIGSALLTNEGRGLDKIAIENWVKQIVTLCQQGKEVVLVSSGAVAEGMNRLGWTERPATLHELQAAAAVGQMGMVQTYETCFKNYGIHTAQVLLTHDDAANRKRYLNARSALKTLINLKVIPVINENDTVATDEIRFGDNDTLAGLVSNLVEADVLVIMTDQQGLYERDPRLDSTAKLISQGYAGDPVLEAMAGSTGGRLGRGGMATKLRAARVSARSGTATWIVSGRIPDVLLKIANGGNLGTLLLPAQPPVEARKQWLGANQKMRGELYLDDGAVNVLRSSGKSLLAVGVKQIKGDFTRGDMVACLTLDGQEIARGIVNYSAEETTRIKGQASNRIAEILGYVDEPELIHRDNLILL